MLLQIVVGIAFGYLVFKHEYKGGAIESHFWAIIQVFPLGFALGLFILIVLLIGWLLKGGFSIYQFCCFYLYLRNCAVDRERRWAVVTFAFAMVWMVSCPHGFAWRSTSDSPVAKSHNATR
jgi:hypothetical protein